MSDFDFLTDTIDCRRAEWTPSQAVRLPPDGVVAELSRFALTANNLTYAKLGHSFGYWRYFPAPQGWGRVPVWGIARVVQSSAKGIAEGERVYGFLPISTHCALIPAFKGRSGFIDATPHRAGLPSTYNEYRLIDREPYFDPGDEDAFLALRPLFSLGFFLARWLEEKGYFDAERVLVSSASSKAAAAFAHEAGARVEKIGLTSERNVTAVANAGLFDEAAPYSAIGLDPGLTARRALFLDFSGDPAIVDRLRQTMGAELVRTIAVGATHGDPGLLETDNAARQDTEVFFAPTHILRLREQWGAVRLRERLAESSARFMKAAKPWLRFEVGAGRKAIARAYHSVARGLAPPDVAAILTAPDRD